MEKVSRIFFIFFVLLFFSFALYSHPHDGHNGQPGEQFTVFEENGKVGLKDQHGQVLIPAEYEAMGWSNGQFSIVGNVTGYRSAGLWGLINLGNNRVTKAEYEDLSPGEGTLIVARRKKPGSVRVQAGCINTAGREVIPFVYDGIRISAFRAIVYTRTGAQFRHGLIDFGNRILIPLQYRDIYPLGSLRYGVENFENQTAIFTEDGRQVTGFVIDSLSWFQKDFAVFYQKQMQGLIDRTGIVRLEPIYRDIKIASDGSVTGRKADSWLFLEGDNHHVRQVNADSVIALQPNLLKLVTANKIQITGLDLKPLSESLFDAIGPFQDGLAVCRVNGKTGVIDNKGQMRIPPVFTSIFIGKGHFRAIERAAGKDQWIVLDGQGKKVSRKSYDFIGEFNGEFFPAKKRGYWGALNASGEEIIACVHDSIAGHGGGRVVVRFKGGYGIITLKEEWKVTPQPYQLELINDDLYFLRTTTTTFLRSYRNGIIYFSDHPLTLKADHLIEHLHSGEIRKISMDGLIVERSGPPAPVEITSSEHEGLRAMKKDGRYGFIDELGRLRIANRYEDVRDFSESLAAVKIRGKWGFINHDDKIAVQPAYDDVTAFSGGVSVVSQQGVYGLIDPRGEILLPVRYDSVVPVADGRIKIKQHDLWGLANAKGQILIQPKYDRVDDLNNGYVIIERFGKAGLLTLQGVSTIPQIYDGLTFDPYHKQYIALKRSAWENIQL